MSVGIIMGNVAAANGIQVSVTVPEISASTSEENTFTLPGVKVGDLVMVAPLTFSAGLIYGSARVSAANTVAYTIGNCTTNPVTPGEVTFQVTVLRPEGVPSQQTKLSF